MKLVHNSISWKQLVGADVDLTQEWISGASMIDIFEIIYSTETGK